MDPGVPPHCAQAKTVIGWREPVSFPQWGIRRLKTKVDTGARTSALHVSDVELLENGQVRFRAVVRVRRLGGRVVLRRVPIETPVARTTVVRSSTGRLQHRFVVRAHARIGSLEREIEVTLVCRRRMLCRLLLGRTALEGFLVDPGRRRVLTPAPRPREAGA
jgi:hypothetical protein